MVSGFVDWTGLLVNLITDSQIAMMLHETYSIVLAVNRHKLNTTTR